MSQHHKINYIEIPVKALASSKAFFSKVFGWEFVDYGDDYAAIVGGGVDGGVGSVVCQTPLAHGGATSCNGPRALKSPHEHEAAKEH